MTTHQSQIVKIFHGNRSGSSRLDERTRKPASQSPIPIAPRPFVYNPLRPGEIRLIDIFPSRERSAPIRAILKNQLLQYATFEAISRAVEGEEQRATIDVNGQPVKVSDKLLEALRDTRRETESRTLWVDSICINQNDRKERGEQLERGAEILGCASHVIAWSGTKNGERNASDAAVLDQWLVSGATSSPPTWSPDYSQIMDIGSEHSFDVTGCQVYYGSPPALTSSPGSPETSSASSSPESIADYKFQAASHLDTLPLPLEDTDFWPVNIQDSDLHQLPSGDEILVNLTSMSRRKRPLLTAFPDDLPAPCNQKIQHTQSISADNSEKGSNVVFACPFQKSDPHKYHRCLKYTLNRIKDVKQHIYRQHTQPPYYCARCYQVFTSTDDRDEHTRRVDCIKRDPPHFDGITDDQRNELKKSAPRRKNLEEQWFDVWDVIFPKRPRPQSALIGNYVEEMVPLLRNLWNEKRNEIISDVIETRNERNIDSGLLAEIMGSVFDRFEAEKTRPLPLSGTERTGSPDINSFQLPSQSDADFGFDLEAPFDQQEFSQMAVSDFDTGCAVDMGNYYLSRAPECCGNCTAG